MTTTAMTMIIDDDDDDLFYSGDEVVFANKFPKSLNVDSGGRKVGGWLVSFVLVSCFYLFLGSCQKVGGLSCLVCLVFFCFITGAWKLLRRHCRRQLRSRMPKAI